MMTAPPTSVPVAVVQSRPGADVGANFEDIRQAAVAAQSDGAQLVVFPEYSHYFTPKLEPSWLQAAEPLDGPFVTRMAHLAAELRVFLVAGVIEAVDGGARFSNTLVALDPSGALVATYRKLHLYDAFGARESDFAAHGPIEPPQTFEVGGIRVAMQTCYDLRFPEVTRRLVDAGAELVLVPSEWVPGPLKVEHWRTLLAARAIENTVYIAAADQATPNGVGTSMVIDPAGVVMATLGDDPGILVAAVDHARIAEVRHQNPALQLRRFTVVPREQQRPVTAVESRDVEGATAVS
ncbi:carbon-nitrogen hydrolase family protein [Lysobacter korlensis]|uniref:Carbon-nitrogen hydrolase family protein n=1 Tax=Lysobacter korlensis TaxID=553636 RepID=A0ABV6RRZ4_9GAMM